MTGPVQITLHGMAHSPALEERIRGKAQMLERFDDSITSCRVVVEHPHHHSHKGGHFTVRIFIAVPDGEIVVNRDRHEDVYVAVRDAFDAARRQLEDHVRRRGGGAKSHRAARSASRLKTGGARG